MITALPAHVLPIPLDGATSLTRLRAMGEIVVSRTVSGTHLHLAQSEEWLLDGPNVLSLPVRAVDATCTALQAMAQWYAAGGRVDGPTFEIAGTDYVVYWTWTQMAAMTRCGAEQQAGDSERIEWHGGMTEHVAAMLRDAVTRPAMLRMVRVGDPLDTRELPPPRSGGWAPADEMVDMDLWDEMDARRQTADATTPADT